MQRLKLAAIAFTSSALIVGVSRGSGLADPPKSSAASAEHAGSVPPKRTGDQLYSHWCAACHDPGPGHPGTMAMAGDVGDADAVLLTSKAVTPDVVRYAVRNGFNMMPAFRPSEISDEELALLADHVGGKAR